MPRRTESTRAALQYVVLAAWSLAGAVAGIVGGAAWSPACLAGGIAGLALVGVGVVLGSWMTAAYGVSLVTALALIGAGVLMPEPSLVGLGVLGAVVVGASAPLTFTLRDVVAGAAPVAPAANEDVRGMLEQINEHTMLSDNAKRVLFRSRELAMLRQAIEADIASGNHNVALTLCDEMAHVFGHLEEAEAFRGRILQAREARFEHDAGSALERLDALLGERNWSMVHQEAARIRRLYGDSHLVQDLDQRILQARESHKRELETEFLHAAERDDVESAMGLLKELDRYLHPHEAERLTEVAQGVVVRHRENLGVQFKLAVNDHRWAEAARIGESIIDEFPNTKMADEVRSMLDLLRTRATQAAVAGPGAG